MSSVKDEPEWFVEGKACRVWMTPRAKKVFDEAPLKDRNAMKRRMELLAENSHHSFPPTQFKPQGTFATGNTDGTRVKIYGFKSFQLRVYGGVPPGCRDFVFTEGDIKKTDAADADKLKSSAQHLDGITQAWLDEKATKKRS